MADKKVDEHTIEVEKVVPATSAQVQYDYGFLKKQLIAIQKQKDDDDAKRDAEIAEVEDLIARADALGITEKDPG